MKIGEWAYDTVKGVSFRIAAVKMEHYLDKNRRSHEKGDCVPVTEKEKV